MSRSLKRTLVILGGAAALLVLVALAAPLFLDLNRYKPRVEAAASDALGMDVRIGGRLSVGVLPGFHVTAADTRILGERGVPIASAKRARFWVDLFPLLCGQLRLHRIDLTQPMLSIQRDAAGTVNVARLKKAIALLGTLDGTRVSLSDGTLRYADARSGQVIEASNLRLDVSRIRFAGGRSPTSPKDLSLRAELACGEIRTGGISVTGLRLVADAKNGLFELTPVTMRVFGGQMTGEVTADLSGPVPACELHGSLPNFRIEKFLAARSAATTVEGAMSFSTHLSMQGRTRSEMLSTATGVMSLRGRDLALAGNDLDASISRFRSSQNFSLVDVGAVFFAGPVGLAVTKGYNFATLFRGSAGNSRITNLVSDWTVERGVAKAQDVALATTRNRIALKGGLDFAHDRFADVTFAVIDSKGCATVRQEVSGTFEKPVVEKPHFLTSLAGPLLKLVRQTRAIFPAGPCEFSYSGSVAPPG